MSTAAAPVPTGTDLAWADGHLTSADAALLERARKPLLSVSTANRVLQCPAQHLFVTAVDEEVGPLDPRNLGKGGHSVLERLYELPAADRTKDAARAFIEEAFVQLQQEHPDLAPNNLAYWKTYTTKAVLGDFALEDPTEVDVVAVEYDYRGIALPNGVVMRGFIDRVDRVADGVVSITDYKLGAKVKRPSRFSGDGYGDQMRVYGDCYEAETGERVDSATLRFAYAGEDVTVDMSEPARAATRSRMLDARTTLDRSADTGRFQAEPSNLCGWCPLARSCPVAKVTSQKAIDQAATKPIYDIPDLADLGASTDATAVADPTHGPDEPIQEETMTDSFTPGPLRTEDKSWEQTVGADLNTNSFAAVAATGMYAFSLETVRKAFGDSFPDLDERARATRLVQIGDAFARALSTSILRVTKRYATNLDWQSGAHTRIRGLAYTAIDMLGVPDADTDLPAYFARVESLTGQLFDRALLLWSDTSTEHASLDKLTTLLPQRSSSDARS